MPMAAPYQVLQGDAGWMLGSYHVEDLIFHVVEVHWICTVRYHLLLDRLRDKFD